MKRKGNNEKTGMLRSEKVQRAVSGKDTARLVVCRFCLGRRYDYLPVFDGVKERRNCWKNCNTMTGKTDTK